MAQGAKGNTPSFHSSLFLQVGPKTGARKTETRRVCLAQQQVGRLGSSGHLRSLGEDGALCPGGVV